MAWVDTDRMDNLLQSTLLRQKLFSLDGTFTQGVFDQYEAEARAEIASYLLYAGYTPPTELEAGSLTEAFLAGLCGALMCHNAFAKSKGIAWPAGLRESVEQTIAKLTAIYDKKLPVPGLTPSGTGGYGGISTSSTNELIDGSRPQRLSRKQLNRW